MTMNRAISALALLLTVPAAASAQDRLERDEDRRELRDDRRDIAWFEDLLVRYDAARARRSRRAIAATEEDAARALAAEVREARIELERSRGEVRREVRADEARRDPGEAWRDRHDLRDDRRDRRDDRRDLRRIEAIESEFGALRGRLGRRALDRKRTLLAEAVALARTERHEDRRELRGDRRETREDYDRR
jgi:hypothetical protein